MYASARSIFSRSGVSKVVVRLLRTISSNSPSGSVIATSDASGNGTAYAYSATGEPSAWGSTGTAPVFRYTGQVALPQVALMYYKARMYDPGLGRFLQTDPEGYAQGLNLYAYVLNNYPNATDPSGLCPFWAGGVAYDDGQPSCETIVATPNPSSGWSPSMGGGFVPPINNSPNPSGGGNQTIATLSSQGTNRNMCPNTPAAKAALAGVAFGTGAIAVGTLVDAASVGLDVAGGGPEDPVADVAAFKGLQAGTAIARTGLTTFGTSAAFLATHGLPRDAINGLVEAGVDWAVRKHLPENITPVTDDWLDRGLNKVEDFFGVPKGCD